MKFEMRVDCDNAAFVGQVQAELCNLFNKVAYKLAFGDYIENKWNSILDTNGNKVGSFKLAEDMFWDED